ARRAGTVDLENAQSRRPARPASAASRWPALASAWTDLPDRFRSRDALSRRQCHEAPGIVGDALDERRSRPGADDLANSHASAQKVMVLRPPLPERANKRDMVATRLMIERPNDVRAQAKRAWRVLSLALGTS